MSSWRVIAAIAFVGCSQSPTGTGNAPVLTGDVCSIYSDAGDCTANSQCTWLGTGCACPPDNPNCGCPQGTCAAIDGSDDGSGSGTSEPACGCSEGGVCVAENGQPITCIAPNPGAGDPCTRLPDLTCQDSATISGLCVCN
ncbi:MAG TPA: hypothetical protein VGG74_02915 [Kofleriaceae bacterium]